MCAGALCHLSRADYEIIPELEIKRKHKLKKYPDGIFYIDYDVEDEDGQVLEVSETYWLEVENHRKTGPNMAFMTSCMLQSTKENMLNDINEICGRTINRLALAFSEESKDEKGHKIDHELRVTNSLKSKIRKDLPINFIAMEKYGLGVSSIIRKEVIIKAKALYA